MEGSYWGVDRPEQRSLANESIDAFLVFHFLRVHNEQREVFVVPNKMAEKIGFSRQRIAAARDFLVDHGFITRVKKYSRWGPSEYAWGEMSGLYSGLIREKKGCVFCGVYCIRSILDGRVYVGSSFNIDFRFKQHINAMMNGKHTSRELNAVFNTVGVDGLSFDVLETVGGAGDIRDRERFWIKRLDSINSGFNKSMPCHFSVLMA